MDGHPSQPESPSATHHVDKDSRGARNKRIFEMWLACYTDAEIASEIGLSREAVNDISGSFGEIAETTKPIANHLIDFQPPLYNVWKQQEKTPGSGHFGNSEVC